MKKGLLKGVSINVLLLGIVSFITDISSEMIQPLLPIFIASLGGAGLVIGLIAGLSDSISSILMVISGYWSDKTGKRKPFVFSGYFLSSIAKLFFAFSTRWWHILILKPVERVGKGLRTAPRDAIIADSSTARRGKAFGIHRAMDTSGAIVGSALALILFWFLGMEIELIFLSAGILGFIALVPLFFVRERKRSRMSRPLIISLRSLPDEFRKFLVIATIFALGNFTYMFFILRSMEFFSDPRISIAFPLLLYIWFNLVYAGFSIPSGILSDRIGRRNILVLGYALFGMTCLGFAWLSSFPSYFILFGIYGLSYALIDGNQRAFVSDLIEERLRGTALGTFHSLIGIATLPSSVIAGFLWEYLSPELTFLYGFVLSMLAVLLFVFLFRDFSTRLT